MVFIQRQRMKDLLLRARVVLRTPKMKISRRHLPDYVKTLHQKACRTCSTIIFLYSTNQIIDLWRCRWRCRRQILSSLVPTELKQPRRRRLQKVHKFAYLTMKTSIFARFARAFFILWHFEDVLVLSTTWNDQFLQLCGRRDHMMTFSLSLTSCLLKLLIIYYGTLVTVAWKRVKARTQKIFSVSEMNWAYDLSKAGRMF